MLNPTPPRQRKLVTRFAAFCLASAALTSPGIAATGTSDPVSDPHFKLAPGYLDRAALPDSLQLLPPPPAAGSAALARDGQAREATLALRGSPRWNLAVQDADLDFPRPAENFSCAMGLRLDEQTTPVTYRVMQKVLTDIGLSTYGVKNQYQRVRPFVVHDEGTCRPDQESILRHDGSYPSGHTAAGWGWALILAEIHPERANELLRRGIAFGDSRVICNAHWQSDVDAGRIMGAATVARLHAEAAFRSDLDAARQEIAALVPPASSLEPDCVLEAAALPRP